jgi:GT2 family glycosyltransferase
MRDAFSRKQYWTRSEALRAFFGRWEDHDLGYRVNLAGYRSVYTPETTVLHLEGLSIG